MNREEYKERMASYANKKVKVITLVPTASKTDSVIEEVIQEIILTEDFFYLSPKDGKPVCFNGTNVVLTPSGASRISDAAGVELCVAPVIEKRHSTQKLNGVDFSVVSEVTGKIIFKKRTADGSFLTYGYVTTRDIDILLQEDYIRGVENNRYQGNVEFQLFKKRSELQKHAFQIVDTKLRKSAIKAMGLPIMTVKDINAVLYVSKYVLNRNNPVVRQMLISGANQEGLSIPHFVDEHNIEAEVVEADVQDTMLVTAEDATNENIIEDVHVETVIEEQPVTEEKNRTDLCLDAEKWIYSGKEDNTIVNAYCEWAIKEQSEDVIKQIISFYEKLDKGTRLISILARTTQFLKEEPKSKEDIDALISARDEKGIIEILEAYTVDIF